MSKLVGLLFLGGLIVYISTAQVGYWILGDQVGQLPQYLRIQSMGSPEDCEKFRAEWLHNFPTAASIHPRCETVTVGQHWLNIGTFGVYTAKQLVEEFTKPRNRAASQS